MPDREKVIKGLEICTSKPCYCTDCPYKANCYLDSQEVMEDALALLKEQEARELTMDEWREWKADSRRNPICLLWENDTSPIWILYPNAVHEPALLMGKLKLFTGKPTFEQCKVVKWE